MIIDGIQNPADLKKLSIRDLEMLSGEIRDIIIKTVSANGGHLASNLGMVDAEIALLKTFSLPDDSIVYDVGHQAYAHKLLTGRKEDFFTLRQDGGVSGFTDRTESIYDSTTNGHSGTALSTAIGIAEANKLCGKDNWTVAVIGDGSFTNGMVYEALNQLHDKDLRLIVLLNDNTMSISKNVGGVSSYFSKIRTSKGYFGFKMYLKRFFGAIPLVGNALVKKVGAFKDFIKRILGAETWFESIGIDYIGPGAGNDITKLLLVLEEAKAKNKPVVVHIITEKGLGYRPAEEHPERYHSMSGFELLDGSSQKKGITYTDKISELIVKEAGKNPGLVAVTAAMADGCGLSAFRNLYPDRFYDVGIAEEHAVTFASGLSIGGHGKIVPVLVMYSTFSQRVFDQLWHDFCLQNREKNDLSLVLVLSHGGFVAGDGVTHQGIYDIPLLKNLPDVTLYTPDSFEALETAFHKSVNSKGLSVIRYPKAGENAYGVSFEEHDGFRSATIGDGAGCVITYGRVAENVEKALQTIYETDGRGARLIVLERALPVPDFDEFDEIFRDDGEITVVEECISGGGIGSILAAKYSGIKKIRTIDSENFFIKCGSYDDVIRREGFDAEGLNRRLG